MDQFDGLRTFVFLLRWGSCGPCNGSSRTRCVPVSPSVLVALLFAVRLSFCHCFAGCLTVDILDTADVSIQASSLDEWMKHGKRGVSQTW